MKLHCPVAAPHFWPSQNRRPSVYPFGGRVGEWRRWRKGEGSGNTARMWLVTHGLKDVRKSRCYVITHTGSKRKNIVIIIVHNNSNNNHRHHHHHYHHHHHHHHASIFLITPRFWLKKETQEPSLDLAIWIQQNIWRLNISMEHLARLVEENPRGIRYWGLNIIKRDRCTE